MSTAARQEGVRAGVAGQVAASEGTPKRAFEEVVRELRDYLLVQVRARAQVPLDDADAVSLVQTVLIEMHRNYEKFDPARGSIQQWACGFCRLIVLNHFSRRRSEEERRETFEQAHAMVHSPPDGFAVQARILLHELLSGLDDDVREAVIAYEIGGLTYDEVREHMRGPPHRWEVALGTVRNRIEAAKSAMRRRLEERSKE